MKAVPIGELKTGAEKEGDHIEKAQREKLVYCLLTATDISSPGAHLGTIGEISAELP